MGCTSLGAASRARSTRNTRQAATQTVETAGSTAAVAPAQDLLSGDRDINAPADRCIQCASGWRDSLRRQVAASATHDSHDAEGGRWATGKTPVLPVAGEFAGPRRLQNRIERRGRVTRCMRPQTIRLPRDALPWGLRTFKLKISKDRCGRSLHAEGSLVVPEDSWPPFGRGTLSAVIGRDEACWGCYSTAPLACLRPAAAGPSRTTRSAGLLGGALPVPARATSGRRGVRG